MGDKFNRPSWVALPILIFTTSIICALFGFIWDVSLHIGNGRDPGPLANPAHYFIIIGLFGIFVAGMSAIVLPFDKPGPAPVRITAHWYAPVGGVLMAGCGLYALIGFPLDDIWHRIFGQDVTLWGPTHLMMIGGAGFSLFAVLMLEYEGEPGAAGTDRRTTRSSEFLRYLSFGGLLIGLSVYQIEFDFGVPQFRLVFQPMLIAAAASLAPGRGPDHLGRGAAIIAAVFAIALRGVVALLVGPILGAPINWFPLYLGPAVVVELLALTPLFKRPMAVRRRRRPGYRHRRPVAGVAVDRRRLPLPLADQHLARGPGDGRAGGDPDRAVRRDDRHGAHRPAAARPSRSASGWWC